MILPVPYMMHVEVEVYCFLFPGNYDNISIGELAVQIFIQWIYQLQGSCRVLDIWQKGCRGHFIANSPLVTLHN